LVLLLVTKDGLERIWAGTGNCRDEIK
jgi:hypothetical protein